MDASVSWSTVLMILSVIICSIAVVVLGYMVRSAYDLRIGLKNQLDRGLRSAEEEGGKRARQLRQELSAEIERARGSLIEESRRKMAEAIAVMEKRHVDFETGVRQERVQMSVTIDMMREEIAELGRRVDDLERELLVGGPTDPIAPPLPGSPSSSPSGTGSSGPAQGGGAARAPSLPAGGTVNIGNVRPIVPAK